MIFSLMEIRGLIQPLRKLAGQDLPIKTSWKLLQISEHVEKINQNIEEFRINLVKKYGEKVYEVKILDEENTKLLTEAEYENSNKSIIEYAEPKVEITSAENMKTFIKEFEELLRTEENIEFTPFSIEELGEKAQITPQELFFLKKILE